MVLKTLGEGSFGKVKLCIDTQSNITYAVKIMNKKLLKSTPMTKDKSAYDFVLGAGFPVTTLPCCS